MTELEQYTGGQIVTRNDLRNAATDSWTEVLEQVGDLATRIAGTDFVPDGFKGNVAAVAATILTGREIGFAPMTALGSLHSIKGRVGLSAEAMRALVMQAGHEIVTTQSTSQQCTMKGRRHGSTEWTEVTWTLADARQAKLGGTGWANYPRQMLQARASSELCRLVFPDVIRGLASLEEIDDYDVLPGAPAPAEGGEAPTAGAPVKRATRKRAAAPKAEPAAAPDLPDEEPATPPVEAAQTEAESDDAPDLPDPSSPVDSPDETPSSAPSGAASPGEPGEAPPAGDEAPPLDEDIVDAEVVGEEQVERAPTPMINPGQRSKMMVEFNRLEVRERDDRMGATRILIGRNVDSANHLTFEEASTVLDILGQCQTTERFAEVLEIAASAEQGA